MLERARVTSTKDFLGLVKEFKRYSLVMNRHLMILSKQEISSYCISESCNQSGEMRGLIQEDQLRGYYSYPGENEAATKVIRKKGQI